MSSSATVTSGYPAESQKRHAQLLMQFNQEMFKRNVLTDVECVVEGQVFQAHRALLVCFSPYLKKKLLNADGKPISKKVYIPKIGSSEFEILLRYMYSGNVDVDCNNFFDVYKAASLLEMQDARAECMQLIDGKNEIRTFFYSYVLSKKLGVEHHWQKALRLITHRFEETVFTKEFMLLELKYVVEILSAQSIGARSETIVFLAALNWLNQDYGSRAVHAVSVMGCVRFSCMSMEEIVVCFHPPFLPHVVQIPEVLMMLFRATCYIAAKSQGKETWFKQYACPKRNLTLESLPTELWHQESSRPVSVHMDSRWANSSPLPEYHKTEHWNEKSGLPETLEKDMQFDIDSQEPESKHLEQLIKTKVKKCDRCYSSKEDYNISTSGEDLLSGNQSLLEEFNDNAFDKESDNFGEGGMDFITGLSEKVKTSPILPRNKEYDFPGIPSTRLKSTAVGPREIQYIIPESTKIIHLVKGPIKFADEKTEPKRVPSQDVFKKFPEKLKTNGDMRTAMIRDDTDFARKGNRKTVDFKLDSLWPTKYHSEDKKSRVDREMEQRKTTLSSDNVISSDESIKENGCILVVGGMNPKNIKKDAGGSVHIFKANMNKWIHYTKLPEPRHNHCTACLENTLYVVGGCEPQETIKKNRYVAKRSCFKLNLQNSMWSKMPDMKCARYDHAMVPYKGRLIVIGGQDENGRLLKSMEMYDPKQKHWKLLNSSLCCGRKTMGAAVYADRIWIAGGLIMLSRSSQMEVVSHIDYYHPDEEKWYFNSYLLPSPRCLCCLVEWGEKLYCIGGMVQVNNGETCPTKEVCFIDGDHELWKQGPSLPEARMGGIAVTYGDNLYYLGGFDPETNNNAQNVIFLTPGATSWSIGPPMISDVFGLSAVSCKITQKGA